MGTDSYTMAATQAAQFTPFNEGWYTVRSLHCKDGNRAFQYAEAVFFTQFVVDCYHGIYQG
jgi:hypothetical protein